MHSGAIIHPLHLELETARFIRWEHDAESENSGHAHAYVDAYGAKVGTQIFEHPGFPIV